MQPNYKSEAWYTQLAPTEKKKLEALRDAQWDQGDHEELKSQPTKDKHDYDRRALNKCITDERTKKINNGMHDLIKKDKEIYDNGVVLSKLLIDKCQTYRDKCKGLTKAKDAMGENAHARGGHIWEKLIPTDADGLYLIVEGKAKVVNKLYNYNYAGKKLGKNDFIGDSKFIKSQGFSYFGDIIACKNEQKVEDKQKVSRRTAVKESQQVNARRNTELTKESEPMEEEPEYTTCMFFPSYLLYLIPFYDLYDQREF